VGDLETKLVFDNWVTIQQLNLAKQEAAKTGRSVWPILVKFGYISEESLFLFFSQESGIPYVKIPDYKVKPEILNLFGENFCRQNSVLPLFKVKDLLFVACSNPLDSALIDSMVKMSGSGIEPLVASAQSVIKALDSYCGPEDKIFDFEKFIVKQPPLHGISFIRESERLDLEMPVNIKIIDDKSLSLQYSSPVEGYTRNISRNGTALGIQAFLFLPKGIELSLEFKPQDSLVTQGNVIKAKGEVIYCRMEKGQRYFFGIKLTEIEEDALGRLFKFAQGKNT
jgi:hypothetical protein